MIFFLDGVLEFSQILTKKLIYSALVKYIALLAIWIRIKFTLYEPHFLKAFLGSKFNVPYARLYNPLLNTNHTYRQNFLKNFLEKTFLTFKMWMKNIKTEGYNGLCMVFTIIIIGKQFFFFGLLNNTTQYTTFVF